MRPMLRLSTLSSLLLLVGVGAVAGAETTDVIVARVGRTAVTLEGLTRRVEQLAPFQLRAFGKIAPVQGREYLKQVMVPELLLAERGHKLGLQDTPRMRAHQSAILRDLLLSRLEQEQKSGQLVTDEEVRRYYDDHSELFVRQERIRLQRLLVADAAEAQTLLTKAKGFSTVDEWRNLVREKSVDKATSERSGELGFVAADGSTDVPELEVASTLFEAAQKVEDGQLVPEPVAEGKRFAVVWRRGSRPRQVVDFVKEAPRIREYLTRLQADKRLDHLLVQLRKDHLTNYRPKPTEVTDFSYLFERGFAKDRPLH